MFIQDLDRLDLAHIFMLPKPKSLCMKRHRSNVVLSHLLWAAYQTLTIDMSVFVYQYEIRQRVRELCFLLSHVTCLICVRVTFACCFGVCFNGFVCSVFPLSVVRLSYC